MADSVIVSAEALRRGVESALANARRLVGDARRLLDGGSHPTAYSLAVLAVEEAAKSLEWSEYEPDGDGYITLKASSHMSRLIRVQNIWSYLDVFTALLDDPDATPEDDATLKRRGIDLARSDNAMKQRGFYVDVDGDDVDVPEQISKDDAEGAIRLAALFINVVDDLGRPT